MQVKTDTLKKILVDRGLQQQNFAKSLGINPEFFSRLVQNKVNLTFDMAIRISKALCIRPEKIFSTRNERSSNV